MRELQRSTGKGQESPSASRRRQPACPHKWLPGGVRSQSTSAKSPRAWSARCPPVLPPSAGRRSAPLPLSPPRRAPGFSRARCQRARRSYTAVGAPGGFVSPALPVQARFHGHLPPGCQGKDKGVRSERHRRFHLTPLKHMFTGNSRGLLSLHLLGGHKETVTSIALARVNR